MSEILEVTDTHLEHHLPTPDNGEGGEKSPMNISYGKSMMWYFLLSDAFTFSAFLIAYATIRISQPWWPNPNDVFNAMPFMGHANVPMGFVSIMTAVLIASSVFVVRAVQEGHRMNKKGVAIWMVGGIVGGAIFLGCQAWEWAHLIENGLRPFFNPYILDSEGVLHLAKSVVNPVTGMREVALNAQGQFTDLHAHGTEHWYTMAEGITKSGGPTTFGALFFGITGFHGFHVFTGVCLNVYALIGTLNGTFERRGHYEMIEKIGLYWHFVDLVWVFVFLAFYLM